jgi:NADPH:quinone reductase-like Zn-dependent oxidoreductase
MKQYIHTRYGAPDVIKLIETEKPVPRDNEVRVRIHAASLNRYDWHFLTADMFLVRVMGSGMLRPKNPKLGADIAGRVEAAGPGVRHFRPGDDVYGSLAGHGEGGLAEYAAAPESAFASKPARLSFAQAAAVPMAAVTALQALRDAGHIQPGQKVLINGAFGAVGTFAVQIARHFGAEVTAGCSAPNAERAGSLGAAHVIDYAREDFTRSGKRSDLILGVNGFHRISNYKRALAPQGV